MPWQWTAYFATFNPATLITMVANSEIRLSSQGTHTSPTSPTLPAGGSGGVGRVVVCENTMTPEEEQRFERMEQWFYDHEVWEYDDDMRGEGHVVYH